MTKQLMYEVMYTKKEKQINVYAKGKYDYTDDKYALRRTTSTLWQSQDESYSYILNISRSRDFFN